MESVVVLMSGWGEQRPELGLLTNIYWAKTELVGAFIDTIPIAIKTNQKIDKAAIVISIL
jgi:hypothetical protein